MTPKSLLRHPKVVSWMGEFTEPQCVPTGAGGFNRLDPSQVLQDPGLLRQDAPRAAGRSRREEANRYGHRSAWNSDTRPEAEFTEVLRKYPAASQVVWVQEEPRNMGAWGFVRGYIQPILDRQGRTIGYAGRPESASPSPGSLESGTPGAGAID